MCSVSKERADRCVTHHHACECREYWIQEIKRERDRYRSLLVEARSHLEIYEYCDGGLFNRIDAALEGKTNE